MGPSCTRHVSQYTLVNLPPFSMKLARISLAERPQIMLSMPFLRIACTVSVPRSCLLVLATELLVGRGSRKHQIEYSVVVVRFLCCMTRKHRTSGNRNRRLTVLIEENQVKVLRLACLECRLSTTAFLNFPARLDLLQGSHKKFPKDNIVIDEKD